MQIRKPIFVCFLLRAGLALLCLGLSFSPLESDASEQKLERVKIAFVYKFLSLVEWDGGADHTSSSDLVIGVAGDKHFISRFSVLRDKFIRSRKVSIKSVTPRNSATEPINVLYVKNPRHRHIDRLHAGVGDTPVLTITEGGKDQLQSYMIVIYEHEGYVRFDINNTLARSKGIKLNAKLLELAGRVI